MTPFELAIDIVSCLATVVGTLLQLRHRGRHPTEAPGENHLPTDTCRGRHDVERGSRG